MSKIVNKNTGSELDVFAATLYAEARGEPEEGEIWVAWVIKNRAARNIGGKSIKAVCTADKQFSCWNGKTEMKINEPNSWNRSVRIAEQVLDSSSDPTGGSDHYYADSIAEPYWAKNCIETRKIGHHQFLKRK